MGILIMNSNANRADYVYESELLPNLLEVGELGRIESSGAFGHCYTVARDRVSHVVVIDHVGQGSVLDWLG
jgi:hypothetical protein